MEFDSEALKIILKNPQTIRELSEALKDKILFCPDDLALTLNKLRKNGVIKGKFSEEQSTWVYWIEE